MQQMRPMVIRCFLDMWFSCGELSFAVGLRGSVSAASHDSLPELIEFFGRDRHPGLQFR